MLWKICGRTPTSGSDWKFTNLFQTPVCHLPEALNVGFDLLFATFRGISRLDAECLGKSEKAPCGGGLALSPDPCG